MTRHVLRISRISGIVSVLFLASVFSGAGCRKAVVWPPKAPAEMRLGEEVCAHCRMIVSDGRHGAQRHSPDGRVDFFDDLGCLLAAEGPLTPEAVFVRSFADERWIRGDRVFVVKSSDIVSPMGYGMAAFDSLETAEHEAAKHAGAKVFPFAQLRQGE